MDDYRAAFARWMYAEALAAHQQGLASMCAAAGFTFGIHHTDAGPHTALLSLYTLLAPP